MNRIKNEPVKIKKTVYCSIEEEDYPLDHVQLKRMRKMERALAYMLEHLSSRDCVLEETAQAAGYGAAYFRRAFSEYFGMPFAKYLNKLRLRAAAEEISGRPYPDNLWSKYGYANPQSFSRAFKDEIGIAPAKFNEGNYQVPDMPLRDEVEGVKVRVEYQTVHALRIVGTPFLLPEGKGQSLMETASFAFGKGLRRGPKSSGDDVGIWWHDSEEKLNYLFGTVIGESAQFVEPGAEKRESRSHEVEMRIQGGNYVVFSYPRPEDDRRIPLMSRIMTRFIFREWIPMNRKVTEAMGFTYERFTDDQVRFYLPLRTGMEGDENLKRREWKLSVWAEDIDRHITENLTTESLARIAGYETANYRNVFSLYYGIPPEDYILRRKLYLLVSELRKAADRGNCDDFDALLKKYGFPSWNDFLKQCALAFPEGASCPLPGEDDTPNLLEYYEKNREEVFYAVRNVRPYKVVMREVSRMGKEEFGHGLPSAVVMELQENSDDWGEVKTRLSGSKSTRKKVCIWGNEPIDDGGEKHYPYYIGAMVRRTADEKEVERLAEGQGLHLEEIEGGRYAMFMTTAQTDLDDMEAAFSLLTRCAFGGWISEHRYRVDMSRRTFVRWQKGKFFFYVPLIR